MTKKELKFLCGSAFRSKGKLQLIPLLDSEDYCTEAVIYTHPTRNGRAIGNATLNHTELHLTDNCIRPVFFQLSSICSSVGLVGLRPLNRASTACYCIPFPKTFRCQEPGEASSKHVTGQGQARRVGEWEWMCGTWALGATWKSMGLVTLTHPRKG